jgi:two-component system sensor histidine kinase/response regulator
VELIGRKIHNIIHRYRPDGGEIREEECPVLQATARGVQYHSVLEWYQHKDGHFIPVELTSSLLKPHSREPSGSVILFHDITERMQLESGLRDALAEAEQATRARDQFLSAVSHELRTPLSLIIGNSDLLAEEPLSAIESSDLLQTVSASGRRLLSLVNDILDHSKIEAGKFEIAPRSYTLCNLLDELALIFEAQAQRPVSTSPSSLRIRRPTS